VNTISERLLADNDPSNDLSPQARSAYGNVSAEEDQYKGSDYTVTAASGGPMPFNQQSAGQFTVFTSIGLERENVADSVKP